MTTAAAVRGRLHPRKVGAFLGMTVIVLYCLAPFYWMAVSAFRRPSDQFQNTALPNPFSLDNFRAVFGPQVGFGRSLLNSVIVAGTTTLLTLIFGMFAAYAL